MPKDKTNEYLLIGFFVFPTIWLALIIAPFIDKGLINSLDEITQAMNHPFNITWCNQSLKTIFIFVCIYFCCACIYLSCQKNTRTNDGYGSARWAINWQIKKKYANKEYSQNKLFTQNIQMGLDGKVHRRNLNTLVIGGSGAGKSRFYAKPNIMQCNTSFVILDCKGELIKSTGHLLEKEGYVIKVIDLIDMEKSYCYNPFHYIKNDMDVLRLITNLMKNTSNEDAKKGEDFWEHAERTLLIALFLYLYHEAPPEEQNFKMLLELLDAAEIKEDDENYMSPLDELFERLGMKDPNSIAYKQYRTYKKAAGKTAKSILISVGARLSSFNFSEIGTLTHCDELELEKIGERKTALFAIIPDNDDSFNFLIGMLYTQLFQLLYYDAKENDGLKIPVHFVMDEFCNVALPRGFESLLSTMRSRNIFVSIIIQNLAQLKDKYKNTWETLCGNCDEIYYLGGNEKSTHSYMSESLGKETVEVITHNKTSGSHGNYSTNSQLIGRELLTPDEVRMLDNDYGLLFIKGERPVFDLKYDLLKHHNIKYTSDGGGKVYEHGAESRSIKNWQDIMLTDNEYELLSDLDMDRYFKEIEEKEKLEEMKNVKNK